ncbi:RNA-directed DNA polymerase from mobile element jockey-like, partial [Brachionus plicatilis]
MEHKRIIENVMLNNFDLFDFFIFSLKNVKINQTIRTKIIVRQIKSLYYSQISIQRTFLNETFLKKSQNFELNNYQIIRADRQRGRGGGSALAINNKIQEVAGFEIQMNNGENLGIFSIYSSPRDLNAKSTKWSCKNNNSKGMSLENLIEKHNLFILNSNIPTYTSSGNILDLTICSSSMVKNFIEFEVLDENISDHQPTVTIFDNIEVNHSISLVSKINWQKFKQLMSAKVSVKESIKNKEELDLEEENFSTTTLQALEEAKTYFRISNNNKQIFPMPDYVLNLIRDKNKLRKVFQKSRSSEHKKILNSINNRLKKITKKLKIEKLRNEFEELGKFNQSSSKHWSLLKRLENGHSTKKSEIHIKQDNSIITDQPTVAESFADNLAQIFSSQDSNLINKPNIPNKPIFSESEYISLKNIIDSIKLINQKAAV